MQVPTWFAYLLGVAGLAGAVAVPWDAVRRIDDRAERTPINEPVRPAVVLRPELIELPGGSFLMGSSEGESNADDEEPQHEVTVGSFTLCRTEVTAGQFEAVMGARPTLCQEDCADEMPVHNVTWYEAILYLNRLTERENALLSASPPRTRCYDEPLGTTWKRGCTGYRLPTEAEWEYAARAGSTAPRPGRSLRDICAFANISDQGTELQNLSRVAPPVCRDGHTTLAPVASLRPNAWGFYDMHGNVREWVYDVYYQGFYADPASVTKNPVRLATGPNDLRVVRGGSFETQPFAARSAVRLKDSPTAQHGDLGLRCARGGPPK